MCYRGDDYDFDKDLADTIAEFKVFPDITDREALVMAACIIAPQSWQDYLKYNYNIRKKRSRELLISGGDKYLAGGGKVYWQNELKTVSS